MLKMVLVGDKGVGKTTLVTQFIEDTFRGDYVPTIGVQFTVKSLIIDENNVKLSIWDIAGHKTFEQVRKGFYDQARGFFLVYDVTQKFSLKNIKKWFDEVISFAGDIPCVLIGNKIDLVDKREVFDEDVKKIIENQGLRFDLKIETSAKTGERVDDAFHLLVKSMIKKIKEERIVDWDELEAQ